MTDPAWYIADRRRHAGLRGCQAFAPPTYLIIVNILHPITSLHIRWTVRLRLCCIIEDMAYSVTALALLLFLGAFFLLYSRLATQDPREPPEAPTAIPIVGHLIGLTRNKFNYYVQLR